MERSGMRVHEEFFLIHDIIMGLLVVACILGGWYLGGMSGILLNVAVFLLLFLWIFLTINVMLGDTRLSIYFNVPIFKREAAYAEIAHCRVAKGKWWRGYRHLQPDKRPVFPLGISFSRKALVIEFKDGRRPMVIGCRHAERICQEINTRLPT